MSNFERDMANTMLDAADARIASLEADKADLLRVLGVADEKIRSGEDARGQYIRENAALEARLVSLEGELARARSAIAHDTEATRRIAALEARCRFLEECLRDINEYNECGQKDKDIERVLIAAFPVETAGEQTKKLMARNDTGLMGTEIEWPQPDDYKETKGDADV